MSLENMKKSVEAVANNKDVIDLLTDFPKPKGSFINLLGNFTIIWNITSHCDYECAICATHVDGRKELTPAEKTKVLNSICTAKSMIKSLDFAGGDPLYCDETTNLIQSAINQLGPDRVSITTTGSGIARFVGNQFSDLIKHCEITIDAAHSNLSGSVAEMTVSRNADSYCETNIEKISLLLEHAESLTINIPIINDDLSGAEIEELIRQIQWIKDRHPKIDIDTLLIRLMPVGRLPSTMEKGDYEKYNPIEVAKKIKISLEALGIICQPHCSLRVLPAFNDAECSSHCSMLENKIGIDCAGNVFACAWGGYLASSDPPNKSPFYLGNLTDLNLREILEGGIKSQTYRNIFNEIDSKQHRHFCSVVSYYASKQLFHDYDYLSPDNQNKPKKQTGFGNEKQTESPSS